jgi:hypothetical protein
MPSANWSDRHPIGHSRVRCEDLACRVLKQITGDKFKFIDIPMGCHPEPVEGRRAQWPIRVLSMMLRPLPTWFDIAHHDIPPYRFPFRLPVISFFSMTYCLALIPYLK